MHARLLTLSLVVLGVGCAAPDGYDAPVGSTLELSPDDLTLGQSPAFLYEDNVGLAVFVDVRVTTEDNDATTPLGNIKYTVSAPGFGVYVVPETAILTNSFAVPANFEESKADLCYDDDGNFTAANDPLCAYLVDETTGTAYEISNSFASPEGFAPNYFEGVTSAGTGVGRFWLFVDALPYDGDPSEGNQGDAVVYISTAADATTFTIQTAG